MKSKHNNFQNIKDIYSKGDNYTKKKISNIFIDSYCHKSVKFV